MRDGIFDSATDAWRIFDSGGDCKEDTPAALETCINAKRTTPVDFTNNRQIVPGLSGLTATAGAATTLTDTDVAPAWTTNQWAGAVVRLTSGAGINQGRRVVSNTPTVLTISPAWATNPAAADTYTLTFYGDSNGYCDVAHDADCEGNAGMSSPSDYTVEFTERTSIPAFIAGRKLVRFVGTPGYNPNAGRQTAPWGCGIGPELALLPALRWARRGSRARSRRREQAALRTIPACTRSWIIGSADVVAARSRRGLRALRRRRALDSSSAGARPPARAPAPCRSSRATRTPAHVPAVWRRIPASRSP